MYSILLGAFCHLLQTASVVAGLEDLGTELIPCETKCTVLSKF